MMKNKIFATAAICLLAGLQVPAGAQLLGTAESFAVLGGSTVTNTGTTVLNGDLGVWPGNSIGGTLSNLTVNGNIHTNDPTSAQAESDLASAYHSLTLEAFTADLSGQDLGGMTLLPGVYLFSSTAQLTGSLTLNALGDPHARFDFLIGSTLTTASYASVKIINGGSGDNLYWQVGSSATVGTYSAMQGHILAYASITLDTGTTLTNGSALAENGAVSLDSNVVSIAAVPEPASFSALAIGLLALPLLKRKRA